MSTPMNTRIVIFAKVPQPGYAKTRLIPALGAQGAADLASCMLTHTVTQALAADVGEVELCVTPSPTDAVWKSVNLPDCVEWSNQGAGDLGERMARATQRVTESGASVILIGTDCPALDAEYLRSAAESLQHVDVVLTPAFDGGYVLLGLKSFHASIFDGIAWSTESVALETVRRLNQLDWQTQHNPKLHDIDEPADLKWLPTGWAESLDS